MLQEMKKLRRYITKDSAEYRRALVTLFLGSLVAFGAEYCIQPIIPVLAHEFSLSPTTVSLAMSFGTAGMSAAMLVIATLASHLERKKIMTLAITVASVLTLGIAVSTSFELILAMRLLQGLLLAGFPALAVAYVNEEFDSKIIGMVIGVYVSACSIGGLSGRVIISTLTDFFSWRIGLGMVGLVYLGICFIFWRYLPATTKQVEKGKIHLHLGREFKMIFTNFRLIMLYFIAFAVVGVFLCTFNFITYVLMQPPYQLSQTAIGFIFVIYLFGSVGSAVMGRLSDKYGHGRILSLSCLILLLGIVMTVADSLLLKIAGLAILTYGFFGAHCNACAWSGKIAQCDKAQASSMYMFFYYMGASIIGSGGGWFFSHFGWYGVICFMGSLVALAFAASVILTIKDKRVAEQRICS